MNEEQAGMPVSRMIEFSCRDVFRDFRGKPGVGGHSVGNRLSDCRGGRRVSVAADDVEVVAFAGSWSFATGEDDELDAAGKVLGVFPLRQGIPLIAAHDPEKAGFGKSRRHGFCRLIGITRAILVEFEFIDHRPRKTCGGEAEHFAAVPAAGRAAARLVRGDVAGEETDFIEIQRVLGLLRDVEVPEVDGIEGAAEEGDFSLRGHGGRRLGGNEERFKRRRALREVGNVASFPPSDECL